MSRYMLWRRVLHRCLGIRSTCPPVRMGPVGIPVHCFPSDIRSEIMYLAVLGHGPAERTATHDVLKLQGVMGDSAGSTVVVGGGALTADLFEVLTRASFSTAFEVDAVIGSIFCYALSPSEQNFPVMESPLPYGCPVRSHSTEQSGSLSISSQATRQGCSGGQQGTADRIDSNASPRCGDDIHDKSAKAVCG